MVFAITRGISTGRLTRAVSMNLACFPAIT